MPAVTGVWMRRAAIVSLAVVALGCADTTARPRAEYAPKATATTSVPDAVPMVLETAPPVHVPITQLIAHVNGRDLVQTGTIGMADWESRNRVGPGSLVHRVWPQPLMVVDPDAVTLAVNTTALPDWVVFRTFATVPGTPHTPEPQPTEEIECMRFSEPKCKFTMTNSGFQIRYDPRRALTGAYIVVFGVWHVPVDDQKADAQTPDEVTASWLFDFDTRGEPRALLP